MNRLQVFFALSIISISSLFGAGAEAAVTTFNNRANWQAAVGTSQNISFSASDSGAPLSGPDEEVLYESLTLKGVTFLNVRSYNNDIIYTDPRAVIRVNLPSDTTAFGIDISPLFEAQGTYTIKLSSGEVFTPAAGTVPMAYDFFGVNSPAPIHWIEVSLDSNYPAITNFSFVIATSVIQAPIDIVPGSQINPVKPNSGNVDVAILSTSTFNAMNINVNTVRFGAKGTEAPVKKYTYMDVNGDRVKDLVMEFKMKDTGIVCKATTAKLTGKMKDGKQIQGSGSITTVNCK